MVSKRRGVRPRSLVHSLAVRRFAKRNECAQMDASRGFFVTAALAHALLF